ncbi:c-type cytochrome, methanol metabolism-related [Vineibacter terrae]|uniref:c-type cytochrome, methanol metabolism-related n=1 Tax=Vineibacter terrae TaxID=2586908 RepID=UPI002E312EFC|nr:c-type cytochrome, methanol metabolism-related [Vineibacter terrae]HEX2888880.1 c-type cytochrome, methanol metabolism-related [Vineibacter terrae]
MSRCRSTRAFVIASLIAIATPSMITAQTTSQPSAEEKPYSIAADGTVDWATFNGYRRYHAACHVCHGPDGLGSSFGPNLTDSLKTMPQEQFMEVVVNGKQDREKKMPALGTDRNVMCYINDIYAYLKARSDGAIGRGRPAKYEKKSKEAAEAEANCMGTD